MNSFTRAAALFAASLGLASAATVNYDFNITWVTANPDGAFARPVIGINNQWPIPRIEANVGDRIVINVNNQLGNQSTSLHFHGLFMNGTTHMDGPVGVSQCEIPPGHSFKYDFTIDQPGTYWYHSHHNAQYPDGLRGPLVIHDPKFPYRKEVDHELVLTLSDWYHDQMQTLLPQFLTKNNPTGAEPVPNAALMNETQNLTVPVEPNTTYMFRVINIGAFAGQYLWIEGHTMRIVEVDGVYTEAAEADMVYISAAQRVSFLLTTKNDTSANFPIVSSMDTTLFDTLPDDLNYNVTGWLTYDSKATLPEPALVDELNPFDDMTLVPYDKMELLPEPDQVVELDVIMDNLRDGKNYAFFNNITYTKPKVPSLYTAMSTGDLADNAAVYGEFTHPFVLKKGEIVQIVVNNLDSGRHPFHLHGHAFQAIHRSEEEAGTFEDENLSESDYPSVPMRRDTLVIWPNGNIVMRFKADNPGVWLFHCHIEWHVASGLLATFVEAPLEIQKQFTIPDDHLAVCDAAGTPSKGNAAANTVDFLDLTGENRASKTIPGGFTPRGIVALVFSCLTGVLGVIVVAWYGLSTPLELVPLEVTRIVENSEVTETSAAANGDESRAAISSSNDASGGAISRS
ncbi:multicopper oxidase domain-containing protein [Trichoderma breve]|uniref:Multicopper oxidase domain-containing protein n=1 Tax=Trichoderma breve TaxID=2034170 RepID=A0A9W9E6A6_9HYPO|nr:multicopper oxidase domain-containing protein [Trichoderma breve]KAJ4859040.1 multicopper oxidase domain-containing protein [Trichoderma breve]